MLRAVQSRVDEKQTYYNPDWQLERASEGTMTVTGAVIKALVLTLIMLVSACYSYVFPNMLLMYGGLLGGFILVLIASFKPAQAPWAAPGYALLEGLFVGTVTSIFAAKFDGIVFQAISLTVAALLGMLVLYQSGAIKVTDKLRSGVMLATFAVAFVYLTAMVLGMFGIAVPYLHQGGAIGIGISVVVLGIACFNLLLDFDNIEKGAAQSLPNHYEWVFSMGLLVTLVWIYLEILRLLSYLADD